MINWVINILFLFPIDYWWLMVSSFIYHGWLYLFFSIKPVIYEINDLNSRVPFAHRVGLLSDELYKVIWASFITPFSGFLMKYVYIYIYIMFYPWLVFAVWCVSPTNRRTFWSHVVRCFSNCFGGMVSLITWINDWFLGRKKKRPLENPF